MCLAISSCSALPSRRRVQNRPHRVHDEPYLNNYHEGPLLIRERHSPVGHVEYAPQRPVHDNYEGVQYQPVALHRGPNRHGEPNIHLEPLPYRGEPQGRHVNRRIARPAYASYDPIYTAAQDPYVGVAEVENQQPLIENDYQEEVSFCYFLVNNLLDLPTLRS